MALIFKTDQSLFTKHRYNDYLYIIDWNSLILSFWEANQTILNYYRYIRIIEDVVVYYNQFFEKGISEENQKSIIEKVDSAFLPGNVVEMAKASDI